VLSQSATLPNGVFAGTVEANREAVVLLKASYDRRWTATVDGRSVHPGMVAPRLVGIGGPPGRPGGRFASKPYDHYPGLLAVGCPPLLGLAASPRRARLAELVRPRATTAIAAGVADEPVAR